MRDYYELLGVPKNASQDDVKKAFRKKAHELHPDKGGDADQFKQVNEAYQVLSDEKKRAQYDQFGHAAFQQGGPAGAAGFGGFDFNNVNINMDDLGDFGDVLGNMFGFGGRGGSSGRPRRGQDLEVVITIEFMEAVTGVAKEITLRSLVACEICGGTGAKDGKTITCAACKGSGRVTRAQRTPFGVIQSAVACAECHGRGNKPEATCTACHGNGVHAANRTISIRVPAGIGDGETIRVNGEGEAAPHGGTSGDLYVHIRVTSHPRFRRNGNDVLSEEEIPFTTLTLGGTIAIETVDGPGDLHIPAGTPSGTVFKLRSRGIPHLHGHGRGDQLVTISPAVPKKPTKEQKKLLDQLRDSGI